MARTAAELKATRRGEILLFDPLPFLGARLFFPDDGSFKCLCLAAVRPFSAIIGSLRCAFRSRRSTPVKAVHVTELRTRVDTVRVAQGLGGFAWGPAIVAGTMP